MPWWLTAQVWLLRAAFLALPVLVALALPAARRWTRDVPRAAWVGLAVILAGGLGARLFGSLWSIDHENAIGWVIFEDAAALDRVPAYGLGGHVLYDLCLRLLGRTPTALFAASVALASLTPGLLFLVAWGLLRHAPSALLAAALLAFNPAHVRLSATENLHVPLLFLAFLGLAALLGALSRPPDEVRPGPRGRAPLLLAAVALALAVQTRPLGALLLLPAALVLALRADQPGRWLRAPALWGAAALAAALAAVHGAVFLGRVTAGDGSLGFFRVSPGDVLPRLLEPAQHALVDPAVTPLALALLGAVGVLVLAAFDRRALGVLLPTFLVYTWLHTTHGENPVDQLRFHLGPLPWTALLGGAALLPLRGLSSRRAFVPAATAAAVAFGAAGLWLQRDVLAARYDAQRELSFWQDAVPRLPARGVLVQPDRFMAERRLTTALPLSWFRTAGHDLRVVEASALLRDPAGAFAGGAEVVWYRGVTCWVFDAELDLGRAAAADRAGEGNALLRPECRALEARFGLEPLAEATFRANPDRFVAAARWLTIGFYRLRVRESARR